MKYLKVFNESMNKEDLQEYCESQLAYLIDEGFTIKIYENRPYSSVKYDHFIIWLRKNDAKDFFKWDYIKDYYIPFLQLLSTKYTIVNFSEIDSNPSVRFRIREKSNFTFINKNKDFSYYKVINDNIFSREGYWKNGQFYNWVPDPDMLGIAVYIGKS